MPRKYVVNGPDGEKFAEFELDEEADKRLDARAKELGVTVEALVKSVLTKASKEKWAKILNTN